MHQYLHLATSVREIPCVIESEEVPARMAAVTRSLDAIAVADVRRRAFGTMIDHLNADYLSLNFGPGLRLSDEKHPMELRKEDGRTDAQDEEPHRS